MKAAADLPRLPICAFLYAPFFSSGSTVLRTQESLLDEVHAMCEDARYRRMVLRHCPDLDVAEGMDRFNATIHPRDQMLIHSLRQHQDAGAAFSQYFNIALQQYSAARQIMRASLGDGADAASVLDFACGYGRLLRFLSVASPVSRIWASELQADALTFVGRTFGVHTFPSCTDPAHFEPGRQFDFIWVASLFSHLPEALFHVWLKKLIALLTPRGVLCFSVRDAGLLPQDESMPTSGILYAERSENADLATDIYGTAYASEAFVRRSLRDACGGERPVHRLRRALANEQDLYVFSKDASRDLAGLNAFRRGPWGWVDRRHLSPSGELCLQGWAASLDDGVFDNVEIEVDGVRHQCATGIAREDVSEAFNDDRLTYCGWEFRCNLEHSAGSAHVEVSARTALGEMALLYAGRICVTPSDAANHDA